MPRQDSTQEPQPVGPSMLRHARQSRHEMTEPERHLWSRLRAHRLGPHFRRQHPIDDHFIVDFYCARARLCIEIDGDSHAEPAQARYDTERTRQLEERGYGVIRFSNREVMDNLPGVLEAIAEACADAHRSD